MAAYNARERLQLACEPSTVHHRTAVAVKRPILQANMAHIKKIFYVTRAPYERMTLTSRINFNSERVGDGFYMLYINNTLCN